jgi:hypothetical protein
MSNQSDRKKIDKKIILIGGILLPIVVPILILIPTIQKAVGISIITAIILAYLAYIVNYSLSLFDEGKIVGQEFYENIEELLKRKVIGGEVITLGQDYYNRTTELAKNAKKIRIANFYPNPGGATGVKDADKNWIKTTEEKIKNEREPIEELTRIVSVNNKKRWEWVKNGMINKLDGCPNFNLYYNSKSDELPIPTMVIIDEKQKSGDREEKKNVIIVNYEKRTGMFENCLWFTDPKICAFFIEYYEKLKTSQTTKPLVLRGEKNTNLFDELEKEYGKNE